MIWNGSTTVARCAKILNNGMKAREAPFWCEQNVALTWAGASAVSLCVLGAGVIGCEYATIFAAMGIKTYIVNDHDKILGFLDHDLSQALVKQMEASGVTILFKNSVTSIEKKEELEVSLKSGDKLTVDMFLFAAGRSGSTAGLGCEQAGIKLGPRETIVVSDIFQTSVPHIYAVGDVIGFPALASTSMEQARVAVCHAFGFEYKQRLASMLPMGVYTIPEISAVGETEESCKEKKIEYQVGRAHYANNVRGQIVGDLSGMLKLIFRRSDRRLLGVSI